MAGYDVEVVEGSTENLRCAICKNVLKDAIQTGRGHRACEACYREAKSNTTLCPIDQESATRFFKDKNARKQVDQLKARCVNRRHGCQWVGLLKDHEKHLTNECCYKPDKGQSIPSYNPYVFDGRCPWECGQLITKDSLHKHVAQCVKISSARCCPFIPFGCQYKGDPHLAEHLQVDNVKHARMLLPNIIVNSMSSIEKEEIERREKTNYIKMTQDFRFLTQKVENLMKQVEEYASMYEEMKNAKQNIDQVCQDSTALKENFNNTKKDNEDKINLLQVQCDSIHSAFSDLDTRQLLLENTTYDGYLVWKIDKYQSRMADAMTKKVTALHSPPCFTSKIGYKFCARLYLNGDGIGKDTHMSVFFVLMRSQYDDLLQWPFHHQVTFRILKPSNLKESHSESFFPAPELASFKRPQKEMNIASGCPLFLSNEKLQHFIKNDAFYLEVFINS